MLKTNRQYAIGNWLWLPTGMTVTLNLQIPEEIVIPSRNGILSNMLQRDYLNQIFKLDIHHFYFGGLLP
jgi:hypothetical protein